MSTAVFGTVRCAEVLLRHGADVTLTDHRGSNLLHYLALYASADTMRFFAARAEIDTSGWYGLQRINVVRENEDGLTPLAAVSRRSDASAELKEAMGHLLEVVVSAQKAEVTVVLGDLGVEKVSKGEDEDDDVFYDAVEHWDIL